MSIPTVNESNTKAQILEAFKKVVTQLQTANATKLDPAGEVTAKKNSQTLEKADATIEGSVADKIAALQKNIVNVLGGLAGQLNEEIDTFNNLQNAISLKESELKELFGIENEAFALAALINTQTQLSETFNVEMDEKKTQLKVELDELNKLIQEKRIAYQKEIQELKQQTDVERRREKEEYNYNFERQKRQAQDTLNDELAAKRKEFEEEVEVKEEELEELEKSLDAREKVIEAQEEKVEKLQAEVDSFPAREAQARKEADEQARKDEQKVSAIKENYVKRDYESKAAVLDNKIELLEGSLASEKQRNAELAQKLDEAYNKIQAMALKSVESTNESKAINQLQSFMSNNQK
ncbi:hypothetical protein D3C71_1311950 [compost metagenome]